MRFEWVDLYLILTQQRQHDSTTVYHPHQPSFHRHTDANAPLQILINNRFTIIILHQGHHGKRNKSFQLQSHDGSTFRLQFHDCSTTAATKETTTTLVVVILLTEESNKNLADTVIGLVVQSIIIFAFFLANIQPFQIFQCKDFRIGVSTTTIREISPSTHLFAVCPRSSTFLASIVFG
jgi:hypothetical protein